MNITKQQHTFHQDMNQPAKLQHRVKLYEKTEISTKQSKQTSALPSAVIDSYVI